VAICLQESLFSDCVAVLPHFPNSVNRAMSLPSGGTGLLLFLGCGIFATPAGSMIHTLDSGQAMSERDLTAHEDRLIGLCLTAAAIIVVFAFVLSYS
jgi:hypothetical protein